MILNFSVQSGRAQGFQQDVCSEHRHRLRPHVAPPPDRVSQHDDPHGVPEPDSGAHAQRLQYCLLPDLGEPLGPEHHQTCQKPSKVSENLLELWT